MMAIDTNDVKILIHSSVHLMIKSCWQCLKGHPIISIFLLLLLFFYVYLLPSWFNLLFYTSPLVVCAAVLLRGGVRFGRQNVRVVVKTDGEDERAISEAMSSPRDGLTPRRRLRPTIQAAMSRRTFKKRTCEELGTIVMEDLKVDFILRSFSEEVPLKLKEEKPIDVSRTSRFALIPSENRFGASERDVESRRDDEKGEGEPRQEEGMKRPVAELTDEDPRNNLDLDSSDVEWNKRLESLIARRRARQLFSALSHRTPIDHSVANDLQGHVVAPILTERNSSDTESSHPGSAPSVLLGTNPFDLPYDPSEEKPILTGDGFEEEFSTTQHKDMHFCKHQSFSYGHPFRFVSVFSDPLASVGPGLPRLRRPADAFEYIKPVSEQLSQEVQLKNAQIDHQDEANTSAEKANESQHEQNVSPTSERADIMLVEPRDASEEQGLDSEEEDEERQDTLAVESSVGAGDEPEMNSYLIEDDNDDRSSSSSLEETSDDATAADVSAAVKNEAFRSSVKKVLYVLQKNRSVVGQDRAIPPLYPPPSSDPFDDLMPKSSHPTKMEERSLYTRPSHHLSYSIASDMQVEVSEASSPPLFNDGLNSPIDVESLGFYRDEDDSDEDLLESESSKQELNSSQDTNIDSANAEEEMVSSPQESISEEFEKTDKPGDPTVGSSQSLSDSASPDTRGASVVDQADRGSDTFPTERLQENVPVIGSASTNTEQNIDTYIHLPSSDLPSEDRENDYQPSVSPSVDSEVVTEPEVIDLIPSPRCVLPETVSLDDGASISSDHNINADIQPPTDTIETIIGSSSSPKSVLPDTNQVHEFGPILEAENSSLSDAPQEDHQTATPEDDLAPTRSSVTSVNTVSPRTNMHFDDQQSPVASPSSATSVSPQVPLDEIALRGSGSMHSSIQPFDGVLVARIPLDELPLAEDEVCEDPGEEKSDEKRLQDVVLEPRVSEEAVAQDQDPTTV